MIPSLKDHWAIKAAPFIAGSLLILSGYCVRAISTPQPAYAGQVWSAAANRSLAFNKALEWRALEASLFSALLWILLPAFLYWRSNSQEPKKTRQ